MSEVIRRACPEDGEVLAQMEVEIAKISFGDEAITDTAFHRKRILKGLEKAPEGMLVAELEGRVVAWMWLDKKSNFLTGEVYHNFRSFYLSGDFRGHPVADHLLEAGIRLCREEGSRLVVGKVHVDNLPMRSLYKKFGFRPTHMTMELPLPGEEGP